MEHEKKLNYGLLLTLIVTVAGWAVNFGVCQNKIEQNAKDIARVEKVHTIDFERVETRQASTDNLLQSINSQLVELNTKMTLLLNGKIISDGVKND